MEDSELRVVAASTEAADRDAWRELMGRCDLELEGIYPLGGSPLGVLDSSTSAKPMLCLQVEPHFVVLAEAFEGSCRAIQVVPLSADSAAVEESLDLVGPACEELWLCGNGVDLSALGYEIVKQSETWVRLFDSCGRASLDHPSASSMLGAARHAFGLASVDAVACVPVPSRSALAIPAAGRTCASGLDRGL